MDRLMEQQDQAEYCKEPDSLPGERRRPLHAWGETTIGDKLEELANAFSPVIQFPPLKNPRRDRHHDFIWESVCATVCCCPIGVCALHNSRKVGRCYNEGDEEGARVAAARAQHYYLLSLRVSVLVCSGLLVVFVSLLLLLLFFAIDSRALGW